VGILTHTYLLQESLDDLQHSHRFLLSSSVSPFLSVIMAARGKVEKRDVDGQKFTKEEFLNYYGQTKGQKKWDAAAPKPGRVWCRKPVGVCASDVKLQKSPAEVLQTAQGEKNENGDYVVKIGIIGGSGMDDPELLQEREEVRMQTPFGRPSDRLVCGKIEGVAVVILGRHGSGHTIMPGNVPYRANVFAMKALGCTHLVVSTACGILREGIKPGDLVLLDQFIDRTHKREQTFYDGARGHPAGICHIPMGDPFCAETRGIVKAVADELGVTMHPKGTMVSIEGPRFSSRAESNFFRLLQADTINMTTVPEVVLANEAGLAYCSIAMATDYDCWKEDEAAVDVAAVLEVMKGNADKVLKVWKKAIPAIARQATTANIDAKQAQAKNNIMGAGAH